MKKNSHVGTSILSAVLTLAVAGGSFAWSYEDDASGVCRVEEEGPQTCTPPEERFSAPDCGYVRLDQSGRYNPGTFDFDPGTATLGDVRAGRQLDLGVCYAYTAAQLVDAWRLTHGEAGSTKRVSPMVAAIDNAFINRTGFFRKMFLNDAVSVQDVESGYVDEVIDTIRDHGYCDESLTLGYGSGVGYDELAWVLQQAYIRYRKEDLDELTFAEALNKDLKERGVKESQLFAAPILAIYLKNARPTPLEFSRSMLAFRCRGERSEARIPEPRTFGDEDTSYNLYKRKIDELLAKPVPQPIGVAFCTDTLKKGMNYYGGKDCSGHVAVLAGRRYNPYKDRCEYLIQNSWGKTCISYSDEWDCEQGKVWIDRDQFAVNMFEMVWLDE